MVNILPPENPDGQAVLLSDVRQFVWLKQRIDEMTSEQKDIKARLMTRLESEGESDDKGHLWLDLPSEIEGYRALQRQRRVNNGRDEEAIESVLAERGLTERCTKMVPVLDEDEIMACRYEGLISDEDLDRMFPKTITWAFVPSRSR